MNVKNSVELHYGFHLYTPIKNEIDIDDLPDECIPQQQQIKIDIYSVGEHSSSSNENTTKRKSSGKRNK